MSVSCEPHLFRQVTHSPAHLRDRLSGCCVLGVIRLNRWISLALEYAISIDNPKKNPALSDSADNALGLWSNFSFSIQKPDYLNSPGFPGSKRLLRCRPPSTKQGLNLRLLPSAIVSFLHDWLAGKRQAGSRDGDNAGQASRFSHKTPRNDGQINYGAKKAAKGAQSEGCQSADSHSTFLINSLFFFRLHSFFRLLLFFQPSPNVFEISKNVARKMEQQPRLLYYRYSRFRL